MLAGKLHVSILLLGWLLTLQIIYSQGLAADFGNAKIINQQERQKAIQEPLDASPNIDLQGKPNAFTYGFSKPETPCFAIEDIALEG